MSINSINSSLLQSSKLFASNDKSKNDQENLSSNFTKVEANSENMLARSFVSQEDGTSKYIEACSSLFSLDRTKQSTKCNPRSSFSSVGPNKCK